MRRLAAWPLLLLALPSVARAQAESPPPPSSSSPQLVDRIVAIVDEEPILLSDLEREIESYRFEAEQAGQALPDDPATIRQQMLDRLVEVKLLVAQAKVDGVSISEEDLEHAVAQDLQEIIDRYQTKAALERELARMGMTFEDLENRHRELNRNRYYTSTMINLHIRPNVEVMDREVRDFYEEHKDEVPAKPAQVTLANILIIPQLPADRQETVRERMDAVQAAFDAGMPFEDVAREYSEGPNASRGGKVGRFRRGDLFSPALEEVAWKLPIGVVSEPMQTELGVHFIRVDERDEDYLTISQVLLRVEVNEEDRERALERAQQVVALARGGEDFAELAKTYSDDPSNRDNGGLLGTFPLDQLSPQFVDAVRGMQVGDVADPLPGASGYFVLKLVDRQEGQELTFDEVQDRLRAIVTDQKIETELEKFLDGLREKFYIEIKA